MGYSGAMPVEQTYYKGKTKTENPRGFKIAVGFYFAMCAISLATLTYFILNLIF